MSKFSDALQVSLSGVPSGPVYRAASFIRLNCSVTGGVPPLQYRFIRFCRQSNEKTGTISEQTSLLVTTTPVQCNDQIMCQVTDHNGNTGAANFVISDLTGGYFKRNTL